MEILLNKQLSDLSKKWYVNMWIGFPAYGKSTENRFPLIISVGKREKSERKKLKKSERENFFTSKERELNHDIPLIFLAHSHVCKF